ncbi:hypothetical protein SUGI_1507990 [Cryptomeria japonica]|uniref:Uncharacterized protein n=1 Tax=Cryptomeria japonica TaxID=3369 RepID=A0AAD3NW27_CRYJA|nr:hypothetical protein SUGI_1497630 [Cryptomeria japonica]GLJ59427.1 hypothetical protein SUGI_1507990 [Cryptomeria japonica]
MSSLHLPELQLCSGASRSKGEEEFRYNHYLNAVQVRSSRPKGEEQTVVKAQSYSHEISGHTSCTRSVGTLPSGTLVGTLPYLRYERGNLQDARDRS